MSTHNLDMHRAYRTIAKHMQEANIPISGHMYVTQVANTSMSSHNLDGYRSSKTNFASCKHLHVLHIT